MCDFSGDWCQEIHPGMDFYCPIEDLIEDLIEETPELPMEVIIKIVKMMWRETDRREGALKVYGAMSQKPSVIHTGDGPCLIMTDPQHRLFGLGWGRRDYGNRHDGIVNKASHNHLMTDGGQWGDGDPRLGWRPWTSGPGTQSKSIGFGKTQQAKPWTDEQRLNWCQQNHYVPSELAYYQRQNWGEGVFTRHHGWENTPGRQNLPDWLADELMTDERSNNLMPRNLGHYNQAWAEHIKDVGTIIRNLEDWQNWGAQNEKEALKWIGQAKGDCQRKHKLLKEIISTVPVYQGMWEDLKAQDHYLHTAWGKDSGPSDDPSRGDLSVHHRMGNENHSWVKMREQGVNWRKIWNQVLTYKRNGDSVEYRSQKRNPGRPNLMRMTTDKKMRSYPSGLGAVKPSKAKYKKIKK